LLLIPVIANDRERRILVPFVQAEVNDCDRQWIAKLTVIKAAV